MTNHLHEEEKMNYTKTKASSSYFLIGMKCSQVEETFKDIF
jgi:hypothetical protein